MRLPARFTPYDLFAGPVLLQGAPVWAEHDADGHWRIYRAGKRLARIKTLPTGGSRNLFHPVELSASGRFLTVVDSAFQLSHPNEEGYITRVDRVLLGGLRAPFAQLAGCGSGIRNCRAVPPCVPAFSHASWDASVGDGTVAWLQYCHGPTRFAARKAGGGPLLLDQPLQLSMTPVLQQIAAAGKFVALLNDNEITVWDLSAARVAYQIAAPVGELIARYALQADGKVAIATSVHTAGADPPFQLSWASPVEPFLHPLPGAPVAELRLVDDHILFAEGPEFGPKRALVLENVPDGQRRVLTRFGPTHQLANDGFTFESSYALDRHHAAWATVVRSAGMRRGARAPSRMRQTIEVHIVPLP